jgi:molecular chaperone GrpE
MKEEKNPHSEEEMVLEEENGETHEPDLEEIEERAEDKLKLLREKLQAADEEKRQLLEDLQRAKADFLNSRKRLEEQLERDRERITIKHLEEILPLKDSFDMAMQDPVWNEADEKWRKGVEGIHAQLANVLKSNGITEIEHEAVSHEGDGDTVVAVLQKGYKKGDTIIRPAKVAVGTK